MLKKWLIKFLEAAFVAVFLIGFVLLVTYLPTLSDFYTIDDWIFHVLKWLPIVAPVTWFIIFIVLLTKKEKKKD
ncbi:MAG: hypothetical protein LBH55_00755 [Mycoplasmataceae bacterium]|jgi:ABC-type multidrug transport system permease subunit|nr:hypothetical protein [Mycoplasmataceae bacterium]